MMDLRWSFPSIFLFAFSLITMADTVQGSSNNTNYNILLNDLKHFNMNRHHVTNPHGKKQARAYIQKKFTYFGLHTWTEEFKTLQAETTGVNIVGVLPGRLYKKWNDSLILIGAHYDTVRDTNGVDDNGSGVVAMLQVARKLSEDTIFGNGSCESSVMFVAFDFEEWENKTLFPDVACANLGCGSRAFLNNFKKKYKFRSYSTILRSSFTSYGQLQGAIIMDTMMNYNSTPYSQDVPPQLKKIFPKQYKSILENEKRGDFVLVTGRRSHYIPLLDTFESAYREFPFGNLIFKRDLGEGTKYKLQVFPRHFNGPVGRHPTNARRDLNLFLRSEHISFWNEMTSNRAIFLTDTGGMRSYMRKCYHDNCDTMSHVTNDALAFLSKSCDTVVKTTKKLTKCRPGRSIDTVIAIVVSTALFVGAAVALLLECCRRRRRRQSDDRNALVDNDLLLEETTDDVPTFDSQTNDDQSMV